MVLRIHTKDLRTALKTGKISCEMHYSNVDIVLTKLDTRSKYICKLNLK